MNLGWHHASAISSALLLHPLFSLKVKCSFDCFHLLSGSNCVWRFSNFLCVVCTYGCTVVCMDFTEGARKLGFSLSCSCCTLILHSRVALVHFPLQLFSISQYTHTPVRLESSQWVPTYGNPIQYGKHQPYMEIWQFPLFIQSKQHIRSLKWSSAFSNFLVNKQILMVHCSMRHTVFKLWHHLASRASLGCWVEFPEHYRAWVTPDL